MLTGVYIVYALISCFVTVLVAWRLSVAGRPFLVQVFHGDHATADAVNQLLIVGFYLVNLGLIGITLHERAAVPDLQAATELVSCKIGRTITVLGIMHFCNLVGFCRLRDNERGGGQINAGRPEGSADHHCQGMPVPGDGRHGSRIADHRPSRIANVAVASDQRLEFLPLLLFCVLCDRALHRSWLQIRRALFLRAMALAALAALVS